MKLYFSNSRTYFTKQTDASDSLGSFMSSTQVPNGRVNSVFNDVSIYGKMIGGKECIGVFLYNDTKDTVNNVSMYQIYSALFGKKNNQCKFEYAVTEPMINDISGAIQMELIANTKDEPYNVEWFEPTSKRENAIVKLILSGVEGDVISILDVEIELTGNDIISLMNDIILGFKDNSDFNVQKVNDTDIFFERKELIGTGELIELITPGTAYFASKNFSGFDDGSILLVEELESKKALGIWIKRTVTETVVCEMVDCEDISCTSNQKENLELIFKFD